METLEQRAKEGCILIVTPSKNISGLSIGLFYGNGIGEALSIKGYDVKKALIKFGEEYLMEDLESLKFSHLGNKNFNNYLKKLFNEGYKKEEGIFGTEICFRFHKGKELYLSELNISRDAIGEYLRHNPEKKPFKRNLLFGKSADDFRSAYFDMVENWEISKFQV